MKLNSAGLLLMQCVLWIFAGSIALVVTFWIPATDNMNGMSFAELLFGLLSLAFYGFGIAYGAAALHENLRY